MATTEQAQTCANCGTQADPGQLMCLSCGARMGLVYRRLPSWKAPLAIVLAVLAVAAVLIVLGVMALRDAADDEVRQAPPQPRSQLAPPPVAQALPRT